MFLDIAVCQEPAMVESSGAAAPRKAGLGSIIVSAVALVILIIILLPREWTQVQANRACCAYNLSQIGMACRTWASGHKQAWPDVFTEQSTQWHDVGNTRTDAWSPVRDDGEPPQAKPEDNGAAIQSNTANFWVLVREKLLTPQVFACPSAHGREDAGVLKYDSVRDFRGEPFCSYSFQNALGPYTLTETSSFHSSTLAVAADASPLRRDFRTGPLGQGVPKGITDRQLTENAWFNETEETAPWNRRLRPVYELNSPNHKFQGQNVLYLDGHVEWREHPYCGVKYDNIWLRRRKDATVQIDPSNIETIRAYNDEASYDGRSTLDPKSADDSFLVP
jgi:prepilin-type processing-associated H-X9-DG protein